MSGVISKVKEKQQQRGQDAARDWELKVEGGKTTLDN